MTYKICFLCGNIATTKDHIPPKSFFEKPLPNNLITVPACKGCNTKFSKDEEWFRNQILAMSFSAQGKRLWKNKVLRALNRRPALKVEMRNNIIRLKNGKPAIKFSEKRTNRVIRKIVYGLFFHQFEQKMHDNLQWTVCLNPQNNLLEKYGKSLQFISIQNDAFRYAFAYDKENFNQSLWWLLFHDNALFVVGTTL